MTNLQKKYFKLRKKNAIKNESKTFKIFYYLGVAYITFKYDINTNRYWKEYGHRWYNPLSYILLFIYITIGFIIHLVKSILQYVLLVKNEFFKFFKIKEQKRYLNNVKSWKEFKEEHNKKE